MPLYETYLGKFVELTNERKQHIVQFHPDLTPYLRKIPIVLRKPDLVMQMREDAHVLIFYKYFVTMRLRKYIAVVVKINQRNFILTAYQTKRIKSGKPYEQ